jgi:putative ABC transport system permease protein
MNSVSFAAASIRARPLHSALCAGAAAAGIALLCAVFLLSQAAAAGFTRNAHGIDVIAGIKGSPLQLILSAVYGADVPAGNIDMKDFEELARNPHVRQAIPLALGDNYKGWRIAGSTADYLALYGAQPAQGRVFATPFEAVAGAATGLKIGEQFAALLGFSADSDDVHNFHLYTITGILKPTGTILDRLIVTTVDSVQQLHSHPDAGDPDAAEELALGHQVTAVLLKVRGPADIMNLPRQINRSSAVMAAVPSYEMARLARSLGMGRDLFAALGAGFVALATLMLLSSLASGLALRRYDLAVLRVLGAAPGRLAATVMAEGMILSGGGALIGIAAGHLIAFAAAGEFGGIILPDDILTPQPMDAGFLLLGLATGMIAALIPALSAGRTDIAGLLARGRA